MTCNHDWMLDAKSVELELDRSPWYFCSRCGQNRNEESTMNTQVIADSTGGWVVRLPYDDNKAYTGLVHVERVIAWRTRESDDVGLTLDPISIADGYCITGDVEGGEWEFYLQWQGAMDRAAWWTSHFEKGTSSG